MQTINTFLEYADTWRMLINSLKLPEFIFDVVQRGITANSFAIVLEMVNTILNTSILEEMLLTTVSETCF